MNAAMLLERIGHIGVNSNKRNVEDRNRYANGFKPPTYQTDLGKLLLQVL